MFEALADLFNLATFFFKRHKTTWYSTWMCNDDHYAHHFKYRVYLQYDIRSKGKNQIVTQQFYLRIMPQLLWAMGQENWTLLIKSACFKDTPVTFQWRNLLRSWCVWSGVTPILCRAPWMDPDICRGIILDFQMVLHSICNVEPQTLCKGLDLDKTWQNLWAITLSTITMPILWTHNSR